MAPRRFHPLLFAALLGLALGLDAAAQAPEQPSRAETMLAALPSRSRSELRENGLVLLLERKGAETSKGLEALVIFAKPPERVYRLLSQTSRAREYRPDLDSVDSLERNSDGPIDEHRMRILFRNIVYRLQFRLDAASQRISWSLASGFEHDLSEIEGFWHLYALGESETLGHFGTRVDIGPAFPIFLQELVTRRKLPATIDRTRRWVDSDGRDRP